ncbi:nucleotide disphospho-sugar-binding domain-containing protein [Methylobacterium sp. WL120]|uniref:glycosyltransferase n=1 Tax=Methylobacterium sp. WL120 TaxID=2603887 RepID=UPI0011CB4A0C|nr:nucleotide disphospho-sugar-binding domain-containing protein [Methylobacterium sp. WL120]TXM69439.1 glycosyltransferase [Methylobacterium sp. WL120]
MQVSLVTLGSHGDVLPFLALAAALKDRGHRVALAAPAPFGDLAVRAGIDFHALGTRADYERTLRHPNLWHPTRGVEPLLQTLSTATEPVFAWVQARWSAGGGIVVASPNSLGARIAQDKLGLPLVTVHVAPFLIESRREAPVLPGLAAARRLPSRIRHWLGRGGDRYVIDPAVLPGLNAFRDSLGLPPVRRLRHWWNSPTRMVLTFPNWFARPQADWPEQAVQVGFPLADRYGDRAALDPEVARFLDAGTPPIAFTYGSGMRQGRAFFETAVALCRRMGRRGILLAPQADQMPGALPPEILRVAYAPFSALLPRCAALVHHGGIGTVAQALAAGIPQLLVPVAFDHFDEAVRLRRLGVGAELSRRRFTPPRAARVLERLLGSPQVAQACREAAQLLAQEDGLNATCDAVEQAMAA